MERLCAFTVGTGPAGPAAAGPIFGQPTRANMLYELRRVVQFLLQEYTSRDFRTSEIPADCCHLMIRFLLGAGGKHLCRLKKVPVEA